MTLFGGGGRGDPIFFQYIYCQGPLPVASLYKPTGKPPAWECPREGEAKCGETLCSALWPGDRESGWGRQTGNSTTEELALAGMSGETLRATCSPLEPMDGWHLGVGVQLEAWESAHPSLAGGHHSCLGAYCKAPSSGLFISYCYFDINTFCLWRPLG